MKKQNLTFHILLLVFYVVFVFIITSFSAMAFGLADFSLIISFGLINALISIIFFNPYFWKSLLFGFLISGVGLISSYLLWFLLSNVEFSTDLIILPILLNAITQTVLWKVLNPILVKTNRKLILPLSIVTIVILLISFNIRDYWKFEKYYNKYNNVSIKIKLIDSVNGQPVVGNTVELRTQRQPLYGIMIFPLLSKKRTNEKGIATFKPYQGNFYDGTIYKSNNKSEYFEIKSKQLIENDTIEIKTTANTVYN